MGLFIKKLIPLVCVTCLVTVSSLPAEAKEGPFRDVKASFWGAAAVQWAFDNKVADGFPDGTFGPDRPVEQNEFIAMLVRAFQPIDLEPTGYGSAWSTPYINYALKNNWTLVSLTTIEGYQGPVYLNRGMASLILANASGKSYDNTFRSIEYILELGLSNGKSDLSYSGFMPEDRLTRAEAVTLIQRFRNKMNTLRQAPDIHIASSNEFDPRSAKVGDLVAGWKIASIDCKTNENGDVFYAIVEFDTREITISGTYYNVPEGSEFFDGIMFTLDTDSETKIPKLRSDEHRTGDGIIFRSPEAENVLSPQGSRGSATIEISGFSIHYWPKDDYRDSTTFVKAIEVLPND